MERKDVYKLIDGEREYQNMLPQHSKELDFNHSVGDWIIYMEHLIIKAKEEIYQLNEIEAMSYIRKATAVGVAAMENNETLSR